MNDLYSYGLIREVIEERINDIMAEFQRDHGIENGDIPPIIGYKWESALSTLAEVVKEAMDWQEENKAAGTVAE